MSAAPTNVVLAGLGGQGVIKASDILADAAVRAGYDVKKAEVHGMSQRGGSVTSDVRFGDEVLSPMIPWGEADFIVVCAPSEVEVVRAQLKPGGLLIPPDFVDEKLLANKRSLNVALLGGALAPPRHPGGALDRGRGEPSIEKERAPRREGKKVGPTGR